MLIFHGNVSYCEILALRFEILQYQWFRSSESITTYHDQMEFLTIRSILTGDAELIPIFSSHINQ